MADADRCAGCGTELSPSSRYCVKCGRARTAPLLDLERLDVAPTADRSGGRAVEHAVAEQHGPRPIGRRSLLAIVAALVVLVGAVVVLSGGDSGGDAATPTTTAAPTTRRPPTTTLPPVVTGQIGDGPVLGQSTGGRSLYAVNGATIARIELDTGAVTILRGAFRRSGSYTSALLARDGRLIVGRDAVTYSLPADLSAAPVLLDGISLDQGLSGDRLLSARSEDAPDAPVVVDEFSTDGSIVRSWRLPPQVWPSGVVGDRIVTQAAGNVYLVGTDGSVETLGSGDIVHVRDSRLVVRRCDERLQCTLTLDDLTSGTSTPLALPGPGEFYFYGRSLAPDGRTAVLFGPNRPQLVDLVTGAVLADVDDQAQPAWTPDGAWLFTRNGDGQLVAVSARNGERIALPLPDGSNLGTADLTLAVG